MVHVADIATRFGKKLRRLEESYALKKRLAYVCAQFALVVVVAYLVWGAEAAALVARLMFLALVFVVAMFLLVVAGLAYSDSLWSDQD